MHEKKSTVIYHETVIYIFTSGVLLNCWLAARLFSHIFWNPNPDSDRLRNSCAVRWQQTDKTWDRLKETTVFEHTQLENSSVWPTVIVEPAELQSRRRSCLPPRISTLCRFVFFSRNLHRETLNAAELKQAGQRWSSSWRKKTRWYFLGVREHHRLVKQRKRIWGWILSFMTAETNGLYYNKNLPARCFWSGYCSLCFKTFCSYCCHLPTLTAARCAKKAFWVCGHN